MSQNKILAIADPIPSREKKDFKEQRTEWVPFFKDSDNLYINDLAVRYRRTATLNSIVNSKTNYAVGKEFTYKGGNDFIEADKLDDAFSQFVEMANVDMQDLREVFKDALFNWICFGNVYLHIVRTSSNNQESKNIFVIDSTKVRIDKQRERAFISAYWKDIKNNESFNNKDYPVIQKELWNKDVNTIQNDFVIHLKRSVPEYDYYGLPDYIATLKDCDIEYKIDTYNLDRLENGFFPSVSITQVGSPPEGMTPKDYVKKLKDSYTGEGNSGKMVVQLVDDKETAPIIQEFSGVKEGEFQALEESAAKGIIKGSRFFPQLAGIEQGNGIGGNQIIINQWNIVMNNVITPDYQEPILKLFNMVFRIFDFDYKLGIVNKPPVDFEVDAKTVLDVNEQREILGYDPTEEKTETEEE